MSYRIRSGTNRSQLPNSINHLHTLTNTIMNFTTGATSREILSLDNIRNQLIRLEDTIIFCVYAARNTADISSYRTGSIRPQPQDLQSWCLQSGNPLRWELAGMVPARDRVLPW